VLVAVHWPPPPADRSNVRKPLNASALAKPLMAPRQSPVVLSQPPSTQLPACATVSVIVLVEKFPDSNVPVQVPDMSANGPVGDAGEGAGDAELGVEPPHELATQARTIAPTTTVRLRTTGYEYRPTTARVQTDKTECPTASPVTATLESP
jgi:hypothetical protein